MKRLRTFTGALGLLGVLGILLVATTTGSIFLAAQQAPAPAGGQGRGAAAPPQPMSFFITSVAKGDGANYGGLAGADAHCQQLATAAGRGGASAGTRT